MKRTGVTIAIEGKDTVIRCRCGLELRLRAREVPARCPSAKCGAAW
jgi:hypothetical protein